MPDSRILYQLKVNVGVSCLFINKRWNGSVPFCNKHHETLPNIYLYKSQWSVTHSSSGVLRILSSAFKSHNKHKSGPKHQCQLQWQYRREVSDKKTWICCKKILTRINSFIVLDKYHKRSSWRLIQGLIWAPRRRSGDKWLYLGLWCFRPGKFNIRFRFDVYLNFTSGCIKWHSNFKM